jgi:hypothetical protein
LLGKEERVRKMSIGDIIEGLGLDEAYLGVESEFNRNVYLYRRNENCDGCPFQRQNNDEETGEVKCTTYYIV